MKNDIISQMIILKIENLIKNVEVASNSDTEKVISWIKK